MIFNLKVTNKLCLLRPQRNRFDSADLKESKKAKEEK